VEDPETQARMAAFHQGLQEAGWSVGRNVRIEYRWGRAGDTGLTQRHIADMIALAPDVILAIAASTVTPLLRTTRTIPVVFVQVSDPASGIGQFGAMQSVAPSLAIELFPIGVSDASEIEHGLVQFGTAPNNGLIVLPGAPTLLHRKLIIALAARQHLPAIYPFRYHVADGGLISYGPDSLDHYRRAASYVDRILKGEKPADLPVQAPTKYELVINLKTAKALGLEVPPTLLARADEVIE
jgi:putative ABC transport system substrate-binding protein